MNILLVGAGAVGQVLGGHFQRGGANVSFLVKARQRSRFTLKPLHGQGTFALNPSEMLTSVAEAVRRKWDLIVLCTSSTALRRGTWLDELSRAQGTFVAVQPGLEDPAYVAARVGADRLVWGMFPLMAFADGEATAYWLPPLGKLPFSGPRAQEVVAALNAGKLPARVHPDVPGAIAFSGPLLEMLVIALECAGWNLAAIRLREVVAGLRESLEVVARHRGQRAPFLLKLIRPWMLRLVLPLVKLAPFSVEDYLRRHYTKVGDQTAAGLDTWIRHAEEQKLPSESLALLRARLRQRRVA